MWSRKDRSGATMAVHDAAAEVIAAGTRQYGGRWPDAMIRAAAVAPCRIEYEDGLRGALAAVRLEAGVSQEAIAGALGVTRQRVSELENPGRISRALRAQTLADIADALGITPLELLFRLEREASL